LSSCFACFAGSSLCETALGWRCSMPRRCNRAISPDRVWYSMPRSREIHAPTARVERGRVSRSRLSACPAAALPAGSCPLHGRTSPDSRSRVPDRAGTRSGSCRCRQTTPWIWRNSCRRPAAPAHSRAAPAGVRGTVAGQLNQVAARFAVQEVRVDRRSSRIASTAVDKRFFRISAELGYSVLGGPDGRARHAARAFWDPTPRPVACPTEARFTIAETLSATA
jgi:hypothetical protein